MRGDELRDRIVQDGRLRAVFLGILAAEEVKKTLQLAKSPSFCVVNTDKTLEGGKHWYSVIKHSHSNFDVMDSLGITAETVKSRLGNIKTCHFNKTRVQAAESTQCGQFCFYFCYLRFYNYDEPFEEVFSDYFSENLEKNEENVSNFWRTGVLPNV